MRGTKKVRQGLAENVKTSEQRGTKRRYSVIKQSKRRMPGLKLKKRREKTWNDSQLDTKEKKSREWVDNEPR